MGRCRSRRRTGHGRRTGGCRPRRQQPGGASGADAGRFYQRGPAVTSSLSSFSVVLIFLQQLRPHEMTAVDGPDRFASPRAQGPLTRIAWR